MEIVREIWLKAKQHCVKVVLSWLLVLFLQVIYTNFPSLLQAPLLASLPLVVFGWFSAYVMKKCGVRNTDSGDEYSLLPLLNQGEKALLPPKSTILEMENMFKGVQEKFHVPAEMIKAVTENFSPKNHLGGMAYKCKINGRDGVVKTMGSKIPAGVVPLEKGVRHENLVELLGVSHSQEPNKTYLLYEHVANGSLDKWLKDHVAHSLSWRSRLQIALDVAKGLEFLHKNNSAHMKLKANNVLLDHKMRAKLGDFAMTKGGINAEVAHHVGKTTSNENKKADLEAFGMLLLQLVCGRKGDFVVEEMKEQGGGHMMEEKVRSSWMDPHLQGSMQIDSALSLVKMARSFLVDYQDEKEVPSIASVCLRLAKLLDVCFENFEC